MLLASHRRSVGYGGRRVIIEPEARAKHETGSPIVPVETVRG